MIFYMLETKISVFFRNEISVSKDDSFSSFPRPQKLTGLAVYSTSDYFNTNSDIWCWNIGKLLLDNWRK